jgi:hypothetical protein
MALPIAGFSLAKELGSGSLMAMVDLPRDGADRCCLQFDIYAVFTAPSAPAVPVKPQMSSAHVAASRSSGIRRPKYCRPGSGSRSWRAPRTMPVMRTIRPADALCCAPNTCSIRAHIRLLAWFARSCAEVSGWYADRVGECGVEGHLI